MSWAAEAGPASDRLGVLAADVNGACRQVDVGTSERGPFAPPQTAESCQQHERPVALVDRISERVHLRDGQARPLERLFPARRP